MRTATCGRLPRPYMARYEHGTCDAHHAFYQLCMRTPSLSQPHASCHNSMHVCLQHQQHVQALSSSKHARERDRPLSPSILLYLALRSFIRAFTSVPRSLGCHARRWHRPKGPTPSAAHSCHLAASLTRAALSCRRSTLGPLRTRRQPSRR